MSLRGFFKLWACDLCGEQVYAKKFPAKWCWFRAEVGGETQHACEKCIDKVPEDKRRAAGERN